MILIYVLIHQYDQETLPVTMFDPNGPNKIRWDLFTCAVVLYSITVIPYQIAFDSSRSVQNGFDGVDYAVDVIFFLDILVNFNTALVNPVNSTFITDRAIIAKEYLKFWFWIDVAATVPFDDIVSAAIGGDGSAIKAIRLIRIIRLSRLVKLYRMTQNSGVLDQLPVSPVVLSLFAVLLQVFFIAHFYACFWHYIATDNVINPGDDGDPTVTWLVEFGFTTADNATRYVASLYWTIVTMLTVGYGDIYATNNIEKIFSIVAMLTGGLVFGAIISKVAVIMESRNPQTKVFRDKMEELKTFLETKTHLPRRLAIETKVRALLELSLRLYL